MAEKYQVNITKQAQSQIQEIVNYIAKRLKAPDAARNLLDALEKAILSLSELPYRIPITDDKHWRNKDVHKMIVKNFLIYFWIDENKSKVHVIAVVFSKRNQLKQLANIDFD